MVTMILARNNDNVIGANNDLPWPKCKADMKHFMYVTKGNVVVMGRKTAESLKGPLPNRDNVVLTKNKNWEKEGFIVENSAVDIKKKLFNYVVIGGAEIYNLFSDVVEKIYISNIEHNCSDTQLNTAVHCPIDTEVLKNNPSIDYELVNAKSEPTKLGDYLETILKLTPEEIENTTLKSIEVFTLKENV